MQPIEFTTENGGKVKLAPLSIREYMELAELNHLAHLNTLPPVKRGAVRTFIHLVMYTKDGMGLPNALRSVITETKNVQDINEFNNACNLFYELVDNNADLFLEWNRALQRVMFGDLLDDDASEKKE